MRSEELTHASFCRRDLIHHNVFLFLFHSQWLPFYRYVLVCFIVNVLGDFYDDLWLPQVAMERIQCISESSVFLYTSRKLNRWSWKHHHITHRQQMKHYFHCRVGIRMAALVSFSPFFNVSTMHTHSTGFSKNVLPRKCRSAAVCAYRQITLCSVPMQSSSAVWQTISSVVF